MLPVARKAAGLLVFFFSFSLSAGHHLNTLSPCCLPPVQEEEVWTDAQPQLLEEVEELRDSATWLGLGTWVWLRSWELQLVYGI